MIIHIPSISPSELLNVFIPEELISVVIPDLPRDGQTQGWMVELDPTGTVALAAEIVDDLRQAGYQPFIRAGSLPCHNGCKMLLVGRSPSEAAEYLHPGWIQSWEVNPAGSWIANINPGTELKVILEARDKFIQLGYDVIMMGSVC